MYRYLFRIGINYWNMARRGQKLPKEPLLAQSSEPTQTPGRRFLPLTRTKTTKEWSGTGLFPRSAEYCRMTMIRSFINTARNTRHVERIFRGNWKGLMSFTILSGLDDSESFIPAWTSSRTKPKPASRRNYRNLKKHTTNCSTKETRFWAVWSQKVSDAKNYGLFWNDCGNTKTHTCCLFVIIKRRLRIIKLNETCVIVKPNKRCPAVSVHGTV